MRTSPGNWRIVVSYQGKSTSHQTHLPHSKPGYAILGVVCSRLLGESITESILHQRCSQVERSGIHLSCRIPGHPSLRFDVDADSPRNDAVRTEISHNASYRLACVCFAGETHSGNILDHERNANLCESSSFRRTTRRRSRMCYTALTTQSQIVSLLKEPYHRHREDGLAK
jgi:hypothetical protein